MKHLQLYEGYVQTVHQHHLNILNAQKALSDLEEAGKQQIQAFAMQMDDDWVELAPGLDISRDHRNRIDVSTPIMRGDLRGCDAETLALLLDAIEAKYPGYLEGAEMGFFTKETK